MAASNEIMYVYHLPHLERRKLCFILDQNDQWEVLAAEYMDFPITTIQVKHSSPTNLNFSVFLKCFSI